MDTLNITYICYSIQMEISSFDVEFSIRNKRTDQKIQEFN